jgi:aminoglycoside/choline kinase family phosphotransferase
MMSDPGIPASAGALTPEWLTRALRGTGTITDARVTSCHAELFGEGKGFSGQLARVGLRYDLAEDGAPASLIAKFQFPHPDPDIRAAVLQARVHEREFCFYRDVAQHVALRTPRMYYGALRAETGECVLLLEDLAPAQTLRLLDGCTAEDASVALRHLAAFHAAWWEHPRLDDMDWLPGVGEQAENDQRQYAHAWDVFLTKVGDLLPDGIVLLGPRLKDHVAMVKRYLGQQPRTFLHGDFHLHNLLFDSTTGPRTLTVIDWQACSRGRATRDLVHFLATGLPSDRRRAHELDLLRLYHTTLTEHGVRDYSFEQCLHDYRFTMLDELTFLVMVLAHVDFSANEAASRIRDMAIERVGAAILDHNPGELLRE